MGNCGRNAEGGCEAADKNAVPYAYAGRGDSFSVRCQVRKLTESERQMQVSLKEAQRAQIARSEEQYPAKADQYPSILAKLDGEVKALREAEAVYVTEIFGFSAEREGQQADVSYSVEYEREPLLSSHSTLGTSPWTSILNTSDGRYTEGILLPQKDGYDVTVSCEGETEKFRLYREEKR